MGNRICGVHAVYEALASGRQPIEKIYVARESHAGRVRDIIALARERGVPVRREVRSVLDHMAEGDFHQGIVAIAGEVAYAPFESLFKSAVPLVVVLDGVEDPHNLGAVIRTVEASGASGIVVPERHSAPITPTVVKASAGALTYVPVVRVTNVTTAIESLKERGLWVVGVDMAATQDWTAFDYRVPVALVLGGEHRGIRRLVKEHCDALVRLPMLGRIDSLNISVAAGIVLYEVVRQRGLPD